METKQMTFNEYQELARRTQNKDLTYDQKCLHALHGLSAEVGEIHGIYQKVYQGHIFSPKEFMKELGDLLWFIAEFCDTYNIQLEDVARMNIKKLENRYPNGFSVARSVDRAVYCKDC